MVIKNDLQYRVTFTKQKALSEAAEKLSVPEIEEDRLRKAERDGLASVASELEKEIEEYEMKRKYFIFHVSGSTARKIKKRSQISISDGLLPHSIEPGDVIVIDDMTEVTLYRVTEANIGLGEPELKPSDFGLGGNIGSAVSIDIQLMLKKKGGLAKRYGHPMALVTRPMPWLRELLFECKADS